MQAALRSQQLSRHLHNPSRVLNIQQLQSIHDQTSRSQLQRYNVRQNPDIIENVGETLKTLISNNIDHSNNKTIVDFIKNKDRQFVNVNFNSILIQNKPLLYFATETQQTEVVRALLGIICNRYTEDTIFSHKDIEEKCIDVNAKYNDNDKNKTALDISRELKYKDIEKIIKDSGGKSAKTWWRGGKRKSKKSKRKTRRTRSKR